MFIQNNGRAEVCNTEFAQSKQQEGQFASVCVCVNQ